jgi:hypothetical protein
MDERARVLACTAASIAAELVAGVLSSSGEVKPAIDRASSAFSAACAAALKTELESETRRTALRSRDAHRQHCVAELLQSEKDYLQDLLLLDSAWHAAVISTGVLSREDVQLIFGGLRGMILLSSELVDALQAQGGEHIGEAFRTRIPYVKLYIEFTLNQVQGAEIIAKALRTSSKFREAMDKLRSSNVAMKGVDINGFLIKPTQRITKYPLFLKDLLAHTDAAHPDYAALAAAEEEMKKVLADINQKRQWIETVRFVSKLQPAMTWKADGIDLLGSHCKLVLQDKVRCVVASTADPPTMEPEKAKRVVLFAELLLILRGTLEHSQEVVAVLARDIQGVREEGEGDVVVECPKRALEVTLHIKSATDR